MNDERAKLLEAIADAAKAYFDSNLNYGFNRLHNATRTLQQYDAKQPTAKDDAP